MCRNINLSRPAIITVHSLDGSPIPVGYIPLEKRKYLVCGLKKTVGVRQVTIDANKTGRDACSTMLR
jgi:hypothetical protein